MSLKSACLALVLALAAAAAPAQDRPAVERQFRGWLEQVVWPKAQGAGVSRATFDRALNLPAHTPVAGIEVQKAGATASLYTAPRDPDVIELMIAYMVPLPPVTAFTLDRVRSDFRAGGSVIVKRGADLRWFDLANARATLIQIAPARTVE